MKAPAFWKEKGFISEILIPFSVLYYIILRIKYRFFSPEKYQCHIPVICIGNATVGGAGKTPTAIAIADKLSKNGKHPAFVTKGYKGNIKSSTRVDVVKHDAHDVGDEALLLARKHPCFVGKSRSETCKFAQKNGADIIILDDGLHDKSIHKDLTILVVDSAYGFGNCRLLPSGPLRDKLEISLEKADIAVIIGNDINEAEKILRKNYPDCTIINADIKANIENIPDNKQYIAFAGIGRPEKFYTTLRRNNIDICKTIDFSDHHQYTKKDIAKLERLATQHSAQLITTEKDYVRFPEDKKSMLTTLPIAINFFQTKDIEDKLAGL